jgi:predicted  nucleic acid-binding Zn-ribbon protein
MFPSSSKCFTSFESIQKGEMVFGSINPQTLGEYDLAIRVRDARKTLRDLRHEQGSLETDTHRATRDSSDLAEKHKNLYARLQGIRSASEAKMIKSANRSNQPDVLAGVLELMENRNEEDVITTRNLRSELDHLRTEAERASQQLLAQREKTLRTISALSKEWRGMEAQAHRKREETSQLHHERMELEVRTARNSLEHAQALFGVLQQ